MLKTLLFFNEDFIIKIYIGCDNMEKNTFFRLFLIMLLVTGLFFLYMGYSEFFANIKNTKGYKTTVGYFMKYDMDTTTNPITYSLTYSYVVDKHTYFVEAQNKVSKLPALGTQQKIKYDSSQPEKAVLVELSGGIKYIITGLVFMIVAVFGLINRLLNHYKDNDSKFYKITGIISGVLVLAIGIYIYYLYGYAIDSSAIVDVWNMVKYMILIPFTLILVGLIIIITVVFFKKEDKVD